MTPNEFMEWCICIGIGLAFIWSFFGEDLFRAIRKWRRK